MKAIILIRHGESVANVTHTLTSDIDGYPLTDTGRSQAEHLAEKICNIRISGFYTSPILRALQTAQIISEKCGKVTPIVDERLMERRMGTLNGASFGSREDENNAVAEDIKSGSKKGVETWDELQGRVKSFVDGVGDGVTVAITHHDFIVAAIGMIDNRYDDYDDDIKIATASATTIDFENNRIMGIGKRTMPTLMQ